MDTLRYILVFLVAMGTGYAQGDDEAIPWSSNRKLTWEDFKGEAPVKDRAAATTASGITYQFATLRSPDKMAIDYTVTTFFYPYKSWYQAHLCESLILSHEQLHFDISELYARKMRARMATATFTSNVKAEVKAIYREILEDLEAFQDLYDKETNFSRNREQQLLWNAKIAAALTE